MRPGEAWLLLQALLEDPRSRFHARVRRWKYPITREGMIGLETYNLLLKRWSDPSKYKPTVMPWPSTTSTHLGGPQKRRRTGREAYNILRPGRSGILPAAI